MKIDYARLARVLDKNPKYEDIQWLVHEYDNLHTLCSEQKAAIEMLELNNNELRAEIESLKKLKDVK